VWGISAPQKVSVGRRRKFHLEVSPGCESAGALSRFLLKLLWLYRILEFLPPSYLSKNMQYAGRKLKKK